MTRWESSFDKGLNTLRVGLLPFLARALEASHGAGTSGWDRIDEKRNRQERPLLNRDIGTWAADECLQNILHYLDIFEPHFTKMVTSPREWEKASQSRRGWLNHLLLLRHRKYHPGRTPFAEKEGEDFLYVGSMLLRSTGATDSADALEALFEAERTRRKKALRDAPPQRTIPNILSLSTQQANPQRADYRDYFLGDVVPWVLRSTISTASPYFRFGFKLLTEEGRVFGDSSIQSYDSNIVVHIGRNNWDRPGITSRDLFFTVYVSGSSIESDKFLFATTPRFATSIELSVDRSYCVIFSVNDRIVFKRVVPPEICRRVALYAWGDQEEFDVEVAQISFQPLRNDIDLR